MIESDEQKIHGEDIRKKQMDKEMREKGRHRELHDARAVNEPGDRFLRDLAKDISEMKNRLMNIESILYTLLESKEKDL
jgi:hypothetical protein